MLKYIISLLLMFVCNFSYSQTLRVNLTYYHPMNSNITADGSRINHNHLKQNKIKWCAVSRDIWSLFPKNCTNKRIYIEGFGVYKVKDKMHSKWKRKIDILVHRSNLDKIENKKNIKIRIIHDSKCCYKSINKRKSKKRYS